MAVEFYPSFDSYHRKAQTNLYPSRQEATHNKDELYYYQTACFPLIQANGFLPDIFTTVFSIFIVDYE